MNGLTTTALICAVLLMVILWWVALTRYRWKCVDISIQANPLQGYSYKVTGVTSNGFDFCIHAAVIANIDYSDALIIKYLRAWGVWSMVRIETITDTRTNVIIYFKDLE